MLISIGVFSTQAHKCSQFEKLGLKRHVEISPTRQTTGDVKIGRHMKGMTLCQKLILNMSYWILLFEYLSTISQRLHKTLYLVSYGILSHYNEFSSDTSYE